MKPLFTEEAAKFSCQHSKQLILTTRQEGGGITQVWEHAASHPPYWALKDE